VQLEFRLCYFSNEIFSGVLMCWCTEKPMVQLKLHRQIANCKFVVTIGILGMLGVPRGRPATPTSGMQSWYHSLRVGCRALACTTTPLSKIHCRFMAKIQRVSRLAYPHGRLRFMLAALPLAESARLKSALCA
jgi:hypothetical protein